MEKNHFIKSSGDDEEKIWFIPKQSEKEPSSASTPVSKPAAVISDSKTSREEAVLNWFQTHSSISRAEVEVLLSLTKKQAYTLIKRMIDLGLLSMQGNQRATYYIPGPNAFRH